jgi:S-adenosylmethionine:tRNA ribosyltransferase-isomerase
MLLEDFDYDLPLDLIAQRPAARRAESRLLTLDATGAIADFKFADLPRLLTPGDVLVLNDTRVVNARLSARKATGGKVELLVERVLGPQEALALVRAAHAPPLGAVLEVRAGITLRVVARDDQFYRIALAGAPSFEALLETDGEVPLPPYIRRAPDTRDAQRYQTVFARVPGAAAAPTAGLHFDRAMLGRLRAAGLEIQFLTLHVGTGTFQPVRAAGIESHRMHSERYFVPEPTVRAIDRARSRGSRVVAIGTTSMRALESAACRHGLQAGGGETDLFIRPGFCFRVVDRLLTNFHLPRSTLLMLVAAFAGLEPVLAAYRHAVAQRYRFFSYGDAMLIDRREGRAPAARP